MNNYIDDFTNLPFSLIDMFDDPEDQRYVLNNLILSCIDEHAPLKKVMFTRPPAPWMKDEKIRSVKIKLERLRTDMKTCDVKQQYQDARNHLKRTIKHKKRTFYQKALSCNRSKDVWQTIHKILKPIYKCIQLDPNTINEYFNSIATKLINTNENNHQPHDIIDSLPEDQSDKFHLCHIAHNEVVKQIKSLRNDCSTGFDNIPAKFIKPVADILAIPLTKIINNSIDKNIFPDSWKVACICPIPKTPGASKLEEYRPISVLPII